MSNKIGIVMAGYLDENSKLMVRSELNHRITSIQKENKQLKDLLKDMVFLRATKNLSDYTFSTWCSIKERSEITKILEEL